MMVSQGNVLIAGTSTGIGKAAAAQTIAAAKASIPVCRQRGLGRLVSQRESKRRLRP